MVNINRLSAVECILTVLNKYYTGHVCTVQYAALYVCIHKCPQGSVFFSVDITIEQLSPKTVPSLLIEEVFGWCRRNAKYFKGLHGEQCALRHKTCPARGLIDLRLASDSFA